MEYVDEFGDYFRRKVVTHLDGEGRQAMHTLFNTFERVISQTYTHHICLVRFKSDECRQKQTVTVNNLSRASQRMQKIIIQ